MGLFGRKKSNYIAKAYESGKVIAMKDVDDPTFAKEILGPGIAIEPTEGILCSPVNGVVSLVADTGHAVSITCENGAEVLMHIGIDTVELNGEGYTPCVKGGDKVSVGDKLVEFDLEGISKKGYKMTTPLIVCNSDTFPNVKALAEGNVNMGDELLEISK